MDKEETCRLETDPGENLLPAPLLGEFPDRWIWFD